MLKFNPIAFAKKQGLRGGWIPIFLFGLVILPTSMLFFFGVGVKAVIEGHLSSGVGIIIFVVSFALFLTTVSIPWISNYMEELLNVPTEMRFKNPLGFRPIHYIFLGIWFIFMGIALGLMLFPTRNQEESFVDWLVLILIGGGTSVFMIGYGFRFIINAISDFSSVGQLVESEVVKVQGFGIPPWTTFRMKLKNAMSFAVPDTVFSPMGLVDKLQPNTRVRVRFTPHLKLVKKIEIISQRNEGIDKLGLK